MNIVMLAAAAAAAVFGAATANADAHIDPPVIPAGLSVAQVTPPHTVTCNAPVFAAKSASVVLGDITSAQDQPLNNLINDQSVTSFTMNCGNGVMFGTVSGNGLDLPDVSAIMESCVGC
jgi:hypothetical protein